MKLNKATAYICVAVFAVSMVWIIGYGVAQKAEKVEWLGWIQVAKPSTSPDPRMHMKKSYDSWLLLDSGVLHIMDRT